MKPLLIISIIFVFIYIVSLNKDNYKKCMIEQIKNCNNDNNIDCYQDSKEFCDIDNF